MVVSGILICFIGWIKPQPSSSTTKGNHFWTFKTHSKKKHNIVVFGDSRIYRGVSPSELTKGYPNYFAVNLGYSSAGMDDQLFDFIVERLDLNNDPHIILGITPHSLTPKAIANEHYIQEKNRSAFTVYQRMYLEEYLAFFDRMTTAEIFYALFDKHPAFQSFEEFHEDGWVASYILPADSNSALENYRKEFMDNKVTDQSVSNLLTRVKSWNEKGIKVYAFRPPTTRAMVILEDKLSGFDTDKFSERFELNGGIWLSFDYADFVSYDGSHLHYDEAKRLSRLLKEKIFNTLPNKSS